MDCSSHAFSPPAQILSLQSAKTLAPGKKSVSGLAGYHGVVLGPHVVTGTASFRYGVVEGLELSADGNVLRVRTYGGTIPSSPFIGGLRVGFKYQPVRHLALTSGFGGGYSAGGSFLGSDFGAILSGEKAGFVPFLSLHAELSLPLVARDVVFGVSPEGIPDIQSPNPTHYLGAATGLRIPVHSLDDPEKQLFLMVGAGWTRAIDVATLVDNDFWEGRMGFELSY